MSRCLRMLPLLLLLLVACRPQPPRPDQLSFPSLDFHLPEVERLTLPNGIRLYLKEDHELPLVEITAMVGAGSIADPADRTGQGGLFGTALRTGGTAGRSPAELDETLARLAADLGVATDTYTTTLGLSVLAADLPAGVDLLADVLRRPAFAPERLELARRQAREAIRRQDDDPDAVAQRLLMAALYGDHPLGRSPTAATVEAIGREDLVDFHRRYFHPNNLWLAISGDFSRDRLLELIERAFGDWPATDFSSQAIPPLPEGGPAEVLVAVKNLPQTTILMGEIGVDKSAPDLPAVRVMNYLLGGGGFNSRLMREIRSDRGLAYSVYSYYQVGRRLPGPFVAGCETRSDATVEVAALMRRVMAGMREEPVSPAELDLARESLINSFVFAFTDTHEVVTQVMRLDFFDYPPDYLETFRDRVAAVTAADVLQAARDRLHPDRQTMVLVGDREAFGADLDALGPPVREVPLKAGPDSAPARP